jgi:hypothetical protein
MGVTGIWLGQRNMLTGEITAPYVARIRLNVLADDDGRAILTDDNQAIEF